VDFNEAVAAGAVDVDEEWYDKVMGTTNLQFNCGKVIGVSSSQLAEFVSAERQPRSSAVALLSSLPLHLPGSNSRSTLTDHHPLIFSTRKTSSSS
jgi:hypothetical protein